MAGVTPFRLLVGAGTVVVAFTDIVGAVLSSAGFGAMMSMWMDGVLRFLSLCPTTCRYIRLPSFLSPPSSHKGPMYFYDSISLIQSHLTTSCPVQYQSGVVI